MSVTPLRRAALPIALAILLGLPAVANAALGGGNALTTSLRPDLRSATVQSTNAVDDTTTVRVCFSKAIASLPQAALFHMGDYNSSGSAGQTLTATSATRSTANCADAVFPNSDATQYTYVTVDRVGRHRTRQRRLGRLDQRLRQHPGLDRADRVEDEQRHARVHHGARISSGSPSTTPGDDRLHVRPAGRGRRRPAANGVLVQHRHGRRSTASPGGEPRDLRRTV
jgi:hypothetical protein